jgi:hypothetical protein
VEAAVAGLEAPAVEEDVEVLGAFVHFSSKIVSRKLSTEGIQC